MPSFSSSMFGFGGGGGGGGSSNSFASNSSSMNTSTTSHFTRSGGIDHRFSENRTPGYNMNGSLDMRYKCNKH